VVGPHRPVTLVTGELVKPHLSARLEGTTGVVEVDGQRIEFPDAELWWPHTHGEPHLHDVTVEGEVIGRVGFRTVENRSEDSLDLWVNGVRVFCRGAVWTPGDLGALDSARELGLNMVRVPGIAAYESDAFHQRCDELGLLVWQDLMFATFDYPLADEAFAETVTAEVADQCARLREHPSTVVVCGSAEHEQQAAMFGVGPSTGYAGELAALLEPVVEASGIDAVWVDSSPSGGDPVIRVDTGIAQYFGVGAYRRDLPDVRHSRVGFAAECLAFSNLTDPVVEGGVPQDNGADWDFADVREHYLRQRYGADASEADAQRVTGEVMADVFGEWRRPGSGCGGGIVLWLRDVVPGAGWGLLDHQGRPKPAALALAPTLQPTAVWFVDEGLNGLDVHVAHDRPAPTRGTLVVELLREDGSAAESAEEAWELEPRSHRVVSVEALLGRFADVTYAYRFGPPQHAGVRATLVLASGLRYGAAWRLPPATRALTSPG
jgi:beta-mannosidase